MIWRKKNSEMKMFSFIEKALVIKKVTDFHQEIANYFVYSSCNEIGSVKNEFYVSIMVSFWDYSMAIEI